MCSSPTTFPSSLLRAAFVAAAISGRATAEAAAFGRHRAAPEAPRRTRNPAGGCGCFGPAGPPGGVVVVHPVAGGGGADPLAPSRATAAAGVVYRPPPSSSPTSLGMGGDSGDGGGGSGGGALTTVALAGVLGVFLFTSAMPFMSELGTDSSPATAQLANSAVTRQDPDAMRQRQYESQFERLSRGRIQEKLGGVPAFYVVGGGGEMGTELYMSYDEASEVAPGAGGTVKATTLDQVLYPLVLKRGRMKMAPPPPEVQRAEAELNEAEGGGTTPPKRYRLVPSASALRDAADMQMEVRGGDVPLYLAERLAFASAGGPQVPLFLEKADAVSSYLRLRESGGNRLPAEPTIRSTTLLDELYSMERGTRPGVSQLAFYAREGDLIRADELMGR